MQESSNLRIRNEHIPLQEYTGLPSLGVLIGGLGPVRPDLADLLRGVGYGETAVAVRKGKMVRETAVDIAEMTVKIVEILVFQPIAEPVGIKLLQFRNAESHQNLFFGGDMEVKPPRGVR